MWTKRSALAQKATTSGQLRPYSVPAASRKAQCSASAGSMALSHVAKSAALASPLSMNVRALGS